MKFKYQWWGKGDIDASFGVFFDGFSKILTACGIMIFVFGMPASLVIGRIVPAVGLANFLGNLWYFYEAKQLAGKEKRHNVTSQPFGIGASQLTGWLYLIMGPVYWQTGDALQAFYIGLAAAFLGGIIEILGAFAGRWIVKNVPHSALMGNMASAAFVWLSVVGMALVFDKPIYAVLPLMIVIIDYLGKADKRLKKIPSGLIAIVIGALIAWGSGSLTIDGLVSSFDNIGFYVPGISAAGILKGLKGIVPYLPVIIPLQINNFLTTLQGVEAAKAAGDSYPEQKSMIMDGIFTLVGALFGNPFPTTVYFGHPGWKEIDARAGYSLAVAVTYLIVCFTGLTGVIMAVVPLEAVMVLLVFVGFTVIGNTFGSMDKKYNNVILLSMVPVIFQYIDVLIGEAVQAAGTTVAAIPAEKFAEFSLPIRGIQALSYGAFLSSLLIAAVLALVLDKKYRQAGYTALVLSGCSMVGLIHCESVAWLPPDGVVFGLVYLIIAILIFAKGRLWNKSIRETGGQDD